MNPADCYRILGVQKGASQKEIKSAYRTLSLKYHPDKNRHDQDADKFKQITEAYQILRKVQKSSSTTSVSDVASRYTHFWKKQDSSTMNDEFNFGPRFTGFKNPFGADAHQNYSHFREKESSFISTHIILYGGLGVFALWIILTTILK